MQTLCKLTHVRVQRFEVLGFCVDVQVIDEVFHLFDLTIEEVQRRIKQSWTTALDQQ